MCCTLFRCRVIKKLVEKFCWKVVYIKEIKKEVGLQISI